MTVVVYKLLELSFGLTLVLPSMKEFTGILEKLFGIPRSFQLHFTFDLVYLDSVN